jgi:hypothetical protein
MSARVDLDDSAHANYRCRGERTIGSFLEQYHDGVR